MKKVNMLYSQLSPIISDEHIHFIFTEILHSCSKLFMSYFRKLDASSLNQIARDRITGDVNAFLSVLRNIPSLPDRGLEFEAEVKEWLYKDVKPVKSEDEPKEESVDLPADLNLDALSADILSSVGETVASMTEKSAPADASTEPAAPDTTKEESPIPSADKA